uniref:C-type lectin domain-containing protein n=1 Tax=Caenorhabditis japonica TaxID=281687 RepID=A0A8R1HPL0_CAEJA
MILHLLLSSVALFHFTNAQCQQSGDQYIGDLCYIIPNIQLNFQDARCYCHSRNKNLGVVHSTYQANFLASMIRTQTQASESKFWIGLNRQSTGSRFIWDDGTAMYWSNFDNNFPQDNLFVVESTVNGKWLTLDGTQQLYFVCSYDPRNPATGTAQPSTQDTSTIGYGTSTQFNTETDYTTASSASSDQDSTTNGGWTELTTASDFSTTDIPITSYT